MPAGTGEATDPPIPARQIPVWDLLVRVGHWLLVVMFFIAYFTEEDLLTLHVWAGYGVGIYLVVRVIWGFIGPKHARFTDFAYGPARAARYLKELARLQGKRYIGHSPAGALMVYVLLIALVVTTVTGIALLAVEKKAGPLAPWFGPGVALEKTIPGRALFTATARASEGDEERNVEGGENNDAASANALKDIHELFSSLTVLLVVLHIGGVVFTSIAHRENLVRAMITGRKRTQ